MAVGGGSPTPVHTIFILGIVLAILGLPMLLPEAGEAQIPDFEDMSPLLMLSPLLLLLLVRFLGTSRIRCDSDASTIHRFGGSPVGIAFLLFLVIGLISFRSLVQETVNGES